MNSLLTKIKFTAETYYRASMAVRNQFNPTKLAEIQQKKLRRLVEYCYKNIKFYNETFEQAGLKPGDIQSIKDLHKVPILTKEDLRERFWDFLPRQIPAGRVSRTSGSTGVPVCIFSDGNSRMHNSAAVIRYRKAAGIPLVGSAILTPLKTEAEPDKEAHWTFLQGIHKTYYVNPHNDSPANINRATHLLNNLKKPAVIGITTAVKALARKIGDGIFPRIRPRAALTTGEVLDKQSREFLESIFNTNVVDIYACNEAGDIAWQCNQRSGYHINADNVVVEIVCGGEPAAPGQLGEVVITNLNRFAMPILRYKNGDLARSGGQYCPCGCSLPLLAEISGRTGENIVLPTGKILPWNQFKGAMNHPNIHQFQIIQDQQGGLTIKYVAELNADSRRIERLLMFRYKKLLGSLIEIKLQKVTHIPPAASGKSKLVISEYKPKPGRDVKLRYTVE